VETSIPGRVRTKASRHAFRNDFKGASDGVSILLSLFNFRDHLRTNICECAANQFILTKFFQLVPVHAEAFGNPGIANCSRMAQDLDPEISEKYLADSSGSDARRGFASAGTFQDISRVDLIEFQGTGKIGMSRPGTSD